VSEQNREAMRRDFLAWCERERSDAVVQLERFESGMLTIGTSGPSGYVDGSAAMMEHLRLIVQNMDELIPKVQADFGFIDTH